MKPNYSSQWCSTVPEQEGWYAVVHVIGESELYPSAARLDRRKWDCDPSSLRAYHGPFQDKLAALKWAYEHEPTLVEIECLSSKA